MKHLLSVVACVIVFSSLAGGQSTLPCSQNCQMAKGQPFSVVYNWAPTSLNPDMADGFRLYRNGVVVSEVGPSALQNGTIAFGFENGIAVAGSYSFAVTAYTVTGGEAVGDPISLTIIKGKPAKPTSGRLK